MNNTPCYKHPLVKDTILEHVGQTPLVKLKSIAKEFYPNISIFGKLESINPGGSVKDRPALQMILDGIDNNKLTKDKIILDSTSGNTGIGLAMVGAVLGYSVKLFVPRNASEERKQHMKAYGADIIFTDPLEGSDGALKEARAEYKKNPYIYFKPDQYASPSNPKAHFNGTGPEIWEQTQGKITHFVATVGTTGTIMGNNRFLKSKNKAIQTYIAEPDNPFHGLEGLKHMSSSLVPELYQPNEVDGIIPIHTEESYDLSHKLALEEGIFVGQSSGGAVYATLELAKRLTKEGCKEACIVCILPDNGSRYFSKGLW